MVFPSFSRRHPILILTAALAWPAGLSAQLAPADLSDAEIARQYEQRRETTLQKDLALIDRRDVTKKGGITEVANSFYSGTNLDWANARLAKIDTPPPKEGDNMFWMYPMATVMETGQEAMSAANLARIHQLWLTYFPFRGDTENHWLLYYSSLYLASEENPTWNWYNGKTSAENMAEAKSYIEDWVGITTAHGQGEFNSPNYIEEYTAPLAMLAGWSRDAKLRREARMMLDYFFYEYAVQQLSGEYGGAHSRVYPEAISEPGNSRAAELGWLLFGLGDYKFNGVAVILAMSGYTPPPILWRIAHDRSRAYTERELQRTRWRIRYAGPKAIPVEGRMTVPVYKYTYMDRDFVIGSCQGGLLQPIQPETWSLIWRTDHPFGHLNTFFALQPSSSAVEGNMYFASAYDTIVGLICRSKADYDSPDKLEGGSPYEQVFQNGPALVALYDIPEGARFPLVDTFFSRELTREPDPSGWIFCQGGPAYIGYRPFAPGEWKPMGWTGLLARGAGGFFSARFSDYSKGSQCLVSQALRNGYIVQVAPARAYLSFADFKAAVRALPLRFSLDPTPEATFTALDGSVLHVRYGEPPSVNDAPVDFAAWPLIESPFGHAAPGSHQLEIRYGSEHYLLDFNHTAIKDSFISDAP